jgi:hypothetical protein
LQFQSLPFRRPRHRFSAVQTGPGGIGAIRRATSPGSKIFSSRWIGLLPFL